MSATTFGHTPWAILGPHTARDKVSYLLSLADVAIGGDRPWDIQVRDERFYKRVLAEGSLGFGESYVDGWWDCNRLDELITRIMQARVQASIVPWMERLSVLKAWLFNHQKPTRAYEIGRRHYDIGNELYRRMLDRRMIYSCGYWRDAATLDAAQEAKLDLVCRKLGLEPGMRVLDIGCGWGGAAKFAAERYGVEVVGITVSKEQAHFAQELCQGLPIEIRLQDYRKLREKFDRIYSIGMFEHVGYKNYDTYMQVVTDCLSDNGLFLLHTIGVCKTCTTNDLWVERYIFPNSMAPSAIQITSSIEGRFALEDWHDFGLDYDKTLMHWLQNFENHWDELKNSFDDRFFRIWRFYLMSFAGAFRSRYNHLWQIVLSPKDSALLYQAQR